MYVSGSCKTNCGDICKYDHIDIKDIKYRIVNKDIHLIVLRYISAKLYIIRLYDLSSTLEDAVIFTTVYGNIFTLKMFLNGLSHFGIQNIISAIKWWGGYLIDI